MLLISSLINSLHRQKNRLTILNGKLKRNNKLISCLELYIDIISNDNWNETTDKLIYDYCYTIVEILDSDILEKEDFDLIQTTLRFFAKLIIDADKTSNSAIKFRVQRCFGTIISKIYLHPEFYNFSSDFGKLGENFNINSHIYELCRHLSKRENKEYDTIPRLEWLEVRDFYSSIDILPTESGCISLLAIWKDLFFLSIKNNPENILPIFENTSLLVKEHLHFGVYPYTLRTKCKHLEMWIDLLNECEKNFNNIDKLNRIIRPFLDKNVYEDESIYIDFSMIDNSDYEIIKRHLDISNLFDICFKNSLSSSRVFLYSYLSLHGKWIELFQCVNWSQPISSNAHHLNGSLFPKNKHELAEDISKNNSENHPFFYDNEGITLYACKAWVLFLAYYISKENYQTITLLPPKNNISSIINFKTNLEEIKNNIYILHEKEVIDSFPWYQVHNRSIVRLVKDSVDKSIINANVRLEQLIHDFHPSRELIDDYWDKNNKKLLEILKPFCVENKRNLVSTNSSYNDDFLVNTYPCIGHFYNEHYDMGIKCSAVIINELFHEIIKKNHSHNHEKIDENCIYLIHRSHIGKIRNRVSKYYHSSAILTDKSNNIYIVCDSIEEDKIVYTLKNDCIIQLSKTGINNLDNNEIKDNFLFGFHEKQGKIIKFHAQTYHSIKIGDVYSANICDLIN